MSRWKIPKFPLIAELSDLNDCLEQMGGHPLKLIADKVYKKFSESEWNIPKWSFVPSDGSIEDKKLLPNPDDTFQFSIANEHSKQDFHLHRKIFEIYISYSKMEITYINDRTEETMQISNGVLIVPPEIIHKVKLQGLTFVFQSSTGGFKVHKDKVRIINP